MCFYQQATVNRILDRYNFLRIFKKMKIYNNPLTLARAIGIKSGDIVSLVGGGGKTTTMNHLASELVKKGLKVIVTTTTHIFPPDNPSMLLLTGDINEVRAELKVKDLIVLAGSRGKEKLKGIDPLWVKDLIKHADAVLIEADGSRNKPFKAPHDHEPVIPPSSTIVLPLVGTDAAYKPLSEEWSHRTDRISEITGLMPGETVTPEIIAKTMVHSLGGMKGVPDKAEFIPVINKADSHKEINIAKEISRSLQNEGIAKTIITSHRDGVFIKPCFVNGFVSAVILAAGGSSRMGRPKQGLELGGKTLVNIVIENVRNSIADEVIVVTQPDLSLADDNLYPDVRRVVNRLWKSGQSSSMNAGLGAVNPESDAVIFFMADQPMVDAGIINELIITSFESEKPIVAPLYNGKKGSPVLFKKDLLNELKKVDGDRGGRDLLKRHPVEYVDIDSSLAGMDVDTPEEYARLKDMIDAQEQGDISR
jgi:molybdenum cofactor cytidylyltransferase